MAAEREGTGRQAPRTSGPHRFALTPVRRQRLYEVLAERIVDFVEAQGLSPGERLPPERELSAQLGVSRATLSQALVALEVRGVIDVRHGDGAVLRAGTPADGSLAGGAPAHAEQLREALAPVLAELAALAARRADAATRPALTELLDSLTPPGPSGPGGREVTDAELVAVLGAAGASPVLTALAGQLVVAPQPLDPAAASAVLAAVLAGDEVAAPRAARELVARPSLGA